MNENIAFRKRNKSFSSRDKSISVKDISVKKNEIKLKQKTANDKSLIDKLNDMDKEKEAGTDMSGFRKKVKSSFRTKQNAAFKTKNSNTGTYLPSDRTDEGTVNHDRYTYNTDNQPEDRYNSNDVRKPQNKRFKSAKNKRIINRAKSSTKKASGKIKSIINNNVNNQTDINNPEYKGSSNVGVEYAEKGVKGLVRTLGAVAAVVVKAVISAMTSILGVVVIAAIGVIGGSVIILQNVTYDFIVDEDKFFRENISQISSDFTEEITGYANENGCTRTVVTGELADWKNVIAFFWTLRNNYSKHEQYNNLLSGDDYTDLKEIFNEFNEVSFEIEETKEEKILKVTITNKSLEDMEKYWFFSSEQKMYLESLIAADEIWDGILGMNELAVAAYTELGQTGDKYYSVLSLSEGDEWSIAFIYYLLNNYGYVNDNYLRKTSSIDAFKQYCTANDWLTVWPKIGDIAFIRINGDNRVGIISNVEGDYIYIILGNYDRTGMVKEIYVSKTSGILTGMYAHINMPDAVRAINASGIYAIGNGELLWPVPGRYYVTSTFGPRWGTVHQGMDISCPEGTPVVAAKSGTVSLSYRSSSAGEYIVIDHGDGMCTEYMHNSLRLVSAGEYVEAGQVIAYSGNTGQSTGPHCHFGVRINGTRVDPAPFLGIPSQIGDASQYVTGD